MNVSEEVFLLLNRIDTHPEEFIAKEVDFVNGPPALHPETRWGPLVKTLLDPGSHGECDVLFTKDEQKLLKEKLIGMLREKLRENIVQELVSGNREEEVRIRSTERKFGIHHTLSLADQIGKKSTP